MFDKKTEKTNFFYYISLNPLRKLYGKFNFTSFEFKSMNCEFKSTSNEFTSVSYEFKSTSSTIIYFIKTQVSSFNISLFPKIPSLKAFVRQLVRSVSDDNLMFYFSPIPWLWIQQETI